MVSGTHPPSLPVIRVFPLHALLASSLLLSACSTLEPSLPRHVVELGRDEIVPLRDVPDVHRRLRLVFDRYSSVTAPSGKPIHILAEAGVHDGHVRRARRLLTWFLTDVPGTAQGASKAAVANAMAEQGTTLLYFATEESAARALYEPLRRMDIAGQDLYASESPLVASPEWFALDHRDAAYEEIFHMVHGYGIQSGAPDLQAQIAAAAEHALSAGVYTPQADVLAEWREQGGVDKQYFVSVLEVAYGMWAHADGASFHGAYQVASPDDLPEADPEGLAALRAFLPDHIEHEVVLDHGYNGTFRLTYDPERPYTLRSRFFRRVGLSGSRPCGIVGNAMDNELRGNLSDNLLDGGPGTDIAIFEGRLDDYVFMNTPEGLMVVDLVPGRDGADTLANIEVVRFRDGDQSIEELTPPELEPIGSGS
jgi:hypothetical protein